MKPKVKWVMILMFASLEVCAEYRVFLLELTHVDGRPSRTFMTTLDHLQYPVIFPLKNSERLRTQKTWRCRGNTSRFKPLCPKPSSTVVQN